MLGDTIAPFQEYIITAPPTSASLSLKSFLSLAEKLVM